ncbi:MAG: glycosyl hydrolase, partial [Bacteroidota bacterium]
MRLFFLFCLSLLLLTCTEAPPDDWAADFTVPADAYKPMPFWHINDTLTREGITRQMREAKELAGFTGISVLPLNNYFRPNGDVKVGTSPEFLTEEYFALFQHVLDVARELDMEIILYDDVDFPSGMAGGKMEEQFPEYTAKRLDKIEKAIRGGTRIRESVPAGKLLGVVALDTTTYESIDLRSLITDDELDWTAPPGNWQLMYFVSVTDKPHKKYRTVDFLNPEAVERYLTLTYDEYYRRFGDYFGNTIKVSFFDDIGFWRHPRAWTHGFNDKFEALNGFDPAPHYPALWYDVGPETQALRNAFFRTRAELLAEGYPKLIAQWAKKHGIQDTGHPPGNYDPTPIDMNGDIFKFFRHTAIPLTDAIIRYQFGQ